MFEPTREVSITNPAAAERVKEMSSHIIGLREMIDHAQLQYKRQYDKHRREVNIEVGDFVYLRNKNLRTIRPSPKLEHRSYGPYRIIREVNENAFELDLPKTLRIHPVLPVALLNKASGETKEPLVAQAVNTNEALWEGEMESLHGKAKHYYGKRRVECYLVHWKGCTVAERTWHPATLVEGDPNFETLLREMEVTGKADNTVAKRPRKPPERFTL